MGTRGLCESGIVRRAGTKMAVVKEVPYPRGLPGNRRLSLSAGPQAEGTRGKRGQEPLLWFPQEGTGEAG